MKTGLDYAAWSCEWAAFAQAAGVSAGICQLRQ
jgi:hypothetical protein